MIEAIDPREGQLKNCGNQSVNWLVIFTWILIKFKKTIFLIIILIIIIIINIWEALFWWTHQMVFCLDFGK